MKTNVRDLCTTALLAATVCVFAPWSLAIGPVSVTLATFAVYVVSAVGGWKKGIAAVGLYILLGAVGLPVFSGFTGGVQRIAGATGGYILGYLPCALITGLFVDRAPKRLLGYFAGMTLGTLACYSLGTAWFMLTADCTLSAALGICVLPFLPLDTVKLTAAAFTSRAVRLRLYKPQSRKS